MAEFTPLRSRNGIGRGEFAKSTNSGFKFADRWFNAWEIQGSPLKHLDQRLVLAEAIFPACIESVPMARPQVLRLGDE